MYEGPNPFIDWNGPFIFCWKGMKEQLKQATNDKRMDSCSNLASGAGLFFYPGWPSVNQYFPLRNSLIWILIKPYKTSQFQHSMYSRNKGY